MAFGCEYMITREELAKIKELRKINLYYAEKEYLQHIFLNATAKYPKSFVFKGGTCLRICYGLERASEDLDFNMNISLAKVRELVRKCLKDFELLNIKHSLYSKKEFAGNIRFEIRFEGPLFSGNPESTNTLKIDFNKAKVHYPVVKVVQKLFSDVPLFTLVVMDEREILAEKIRALIHRRESRDLYDLWILLSRNIGVDEKLVLLKLKEEKIDVAQFQLPSKQKYERDLKALVSLLPAYEQVVKEVMLHLEMIQCVKRLLYKRGTKRLFKK